MTTPTTVVELLLAARAIIEKESNWCQHYNATNSDGDERGMLAKDATRFCAYGALSKVLDPWDMDNLQAQAWDLLCKEGKRLTDLPTMDQVNDRRGHKTVMAVYDAAIKQANIMQTERRRSEGR